MVPRDQEEGLFACAFAGNVSLTHCHSGPGPKNPLPKDVSTGRAGYLFH